MSVRKVVLSKVVPVGPLQITVTKTYYMDGDDFDRAYMVDLAGAMGATVTVNRLDLLDPDQIISKFDAEVKDTERL